MKSTGFFPKFAKKVANATGHPLGFGLAAGTIAVWGITGPLFGFSDTWQLVINTSTTIVTFLMVFLIQNTQNRDAHAIQLKLDELIRATEGAHTAIMDSEELTDKELEHIKMAYSKLADEGRQSLRNGGGDQGTPELMADTFGKKTDA